MANPAKIIKFISSLKYLSDNYIEQSIKAHGIKGLVVSHGNILAQLYEEDEQTMTNISSKIGRCKSTLTVLVDKLEKTGFVFRKADTADTRVKKLCLTDEGKKFQKDFWKISKELNTSLWKGFSDEEQQKFVEFMQRMCNNIDTLPHTSKAQD